VLANRPAAFLVLAAMLAACMRPPARLAGSFPPTTVADAQAQDLIGGLVRWGGAIVSTQPGAAETCFEVVGHPLDRAARPLESDQTLGRFIACAPGFYEPAIYAPERRITVVGVIDTATTGKVGEYSYRFPRVRAETIYLWPERGPEPVVYYGPWIYPYPFWGFYFSARRGGWD
jgi:outer membrane lipoprotein